ncbi:alcohol oxidase-like protein [Vararia minispora EC-137]|uniref:Alcohol oxidase-like protein n=1 Tax=Vararia minispora EC-137 TaxID=1314806 RepID=A0ACB8QFS8_9AGAM|nr:alcohol oxidase-like protein [Vararia minispora EC-137]
MSATPSLKPEYDLIIAGGGTAGCIVASRLAAADPNLSILVLEAGTPTEGQMSHIQPARYLHHLAPTASTVRFHTANPTPSLGNRPFITPCGQCLGGGSSVNFAMYTRAAASDYDDWEQMYNNPGWGSKDLIPLLKKAETYQIKKGALNHGDEGPLKVSWGGKYMNIGQDYLATARKYDVNRNPGDENTDLNDLVTVNTYGRWQKWINDKNGHRSDVPHCYVYGKNFPNLHIVTSVHVRRLALDGTKATGVYYTWNKRFLPDADSDLHTVSARKLVLLSAGTFGTPGILERSGIGAPEWLAKIGVETKVNLPGVGENYQDHNVCFVPYATTDDADTLDFVLRNEPDLMDASVKEWMENGQSMMAHNGIDGGVKMRPTPDELVKFGPEFRKRWDAYFAPRPDKPVLWMGQLGVLFGDPSTVPYGRYYCIGYYNEYPAARGHVHATDKDDVSAPTDFRCGFLDDMADVRPLMWGYKQTREISRRMAYFRGEVPGLHPSFPEGSNAGLLTKADGPIPFDAPPIEYSEEDDKAVEAYQRAFVSTAWHSLGTCAMKAREDGGVVDSKLNVYGLEGVKICDMSIPPGNVGANTYSTAVVIGEKGALIVAEALGIKL